MTRRACYAWILSAVALTALILVPRNAEAEVASWYGPGFHGNTTASGEIYNQWADDPYTAAHKTWAFGTRVRVSYMGKSVVVCINDRGPFIPGRDIDLNRAAAAELGIINRGVATVSLTIISNNGGSCY